LKLLTTADNGYGEWGRWVKMGETIYYCMSTFEEKEIPKAAGFSYSGVKRSWFTTDRAKAAKLAEYAVSVELQQELLAVRNKQVTSLTASRATSTARVFPVPVGLDYFPFQKSGIEYALMRQNTLIGDDMGLGKTIQAIGVINCCDYIKKVLVVCPATLKTNWKNEAERWLVRNLKVGIGDSNTNPTPDTGYDFCIYNYGALRKANAKISVIEWDLVILDEAHVIRNTTTHGYKAIAGGKIEKKSGNEKIAVEYGKIRSKHTIALTGTPICNKPKELWGLLTLLCSEQWHSGQYWYFHKRYCGAEKGKYGTEWNAVPPERLEELQINLRETCVDGLTEVYSEYGKIRISKIVEENLHLRVWCRDRMGTLQLRHVVGRNKSEYRGKLVKIVHEFGSITCTPEHRIYTTSGEREAAHIAEGDSVLCVQEGSLPEAVIFKGEHTLRNNMFAKMFRCLCSKGKERKIFREGKHTTENCNKKMSWMWMRFFGKKHTDVQRKGVLRQLLSWKGAVSGTQGEDVYQGSNCKKVENENWCKDKQSKKNGSYRKSKRKHVEGPIEPVEELGQSRNTRKDDTVYTEKTYPKKVRGAQIVGKVTRSTGRILRSINTDRFKGFFCRYFNAGKIYNRNRWVGARKADGIKKGLREGDGTSTSRVLRVKVLEVGCSGQHKGNSRKYYVYDIQVDEYGNYSANGIIVHNCMIRRLKSEVMKELPPKIRTVVELDYDPNDSAVKAAINFEKQFKQTDGLEAEVELAKAIDDEDAYKIAVEKLEAQRRFSFEEMAGARKMTALAKLPYAIDYIQELLDTGKKVVVGVHHHEMVEALQKKWPLESIAVYGETKVSDRQDQVDRFQMDENIRLAIISIKAGGVGITLTASSTVVVLELPWTPGDLIQFEDRCHRIGQTDTVNVYHLVLRDSIDVKMAKTIVEKQEIIESALNTIQVRERVTSVATRSLTRERIIEEAHNVTPEVKAAVHEALRVLAGKDLDYCSSENGMGYNKVDSAIGHSLAERMELSAKQAVLGKNICKKYSRQLPVDLYSTIFSV